MKKLVVLAASCLLMLAVFGPLSVAGKTPQATFHSVLEGAVEFEGNYYMLVPQQMSWNTARLQCEMYGGHLATVASAEENEFCLSLWLESGASTCWLGGSDATEEGNWTWVTGEEWSFIDWGTPEPNGGQSENMLCYYTSDSYVTGHWNDASADVAAYYICEWEAEDIESIRWRMGTLSSGDAIFNNALVYDGHVYGVHVGAMSAEEAEAYCNEYGAHLASITSAEENNMVYRYVLSLVGSKNYMIGGTDRRVEGVWEWMSGETFDYANWLANEPNNQGDEDYIIVDYTTGGWNDISWNAEVFVYEWDNCCFSPTDNSVSFHQYKQSAVLREPACLSGGEIELRCEVCGDTKTEETAAAGHTLGSWTTAKAATCHLEGRNERACTLCDYKEEEVTPILSHEYTAWEVVSGSKLIPPIVKEKTCTLCGDLQSQSDWSFVWVPIVAAVVLIGLAIGVINYFRAFRKK